MSIAMCLEVSNSYTRTLGNDFPYGSDPSFEVSWRTIIWLPMVFPLYLIVLIKLLVKTTILCDFF